MRGRAGGGAMGRRGVHTIAREGVRGRVEREKGEGGGDHLKCSKETILDRAFCSQIPALRSSSARRAPKLRLGAISISGRISRPFLRPSATAFARSSSPRPGPVSLPAQPPDVAPRGLRERGGVRRAPRVLGRGGVPLLGELVRAVRGDGRAHARARGVAPGREVRPRGG